MYKRIMAIYKGNKELVAGVAGSFAVRLASVFVTLYTTPAYMRYFENQAVLGIWFTLISIFNLFINFDLGIGNGLRNRLTEGLATNKNEVVKSYISSAYISVAVFMLLSGMIALAFIYIMPLNDLLNISAELLPLATLRKSLSVCIIGLCIQCILRLVTSVYYAVQKSAIPTFLSFASNLLLLLAVWVVPKTDSIEYNFILLSFMHAILSNIPLMIATLWVFSTMLQKSRPSLSSFNRLIAKDLLRLGLTFFVLQMVGLLITNCNELLITIFIGPSEAVDYQVYNKIFNIPYMLYSIVLTAFWSAITRAKAQKQFKWLVNAHNLICGMIAILSIGTVIMIPAVPFIARVWLREQAAQVNIFWSYGMWFAIWCSANMWMHGNCTFANGLEWLEIQKKWILPAAIVNFIGVFLVMSISQKDAWLATVQVNSIVLYSIGTVQMIVIRKRLKNAQNDSDSTKRKSNDGVV